MLELESHRTRTHCAAPFSYAQAYPNLKSLNYCSGAAGPSVSSVLPSLPKLEELTFNQFVFDEADTHGKFVSGSDVCSVTDDAHCTRSPCCGPGDRASPDQKI